MLDIGFSELLVVAIVALVVFGPERLPQAIKATAYWFGRCRRSIQSVKNALEREIGVNDVRQQLHNEAIMSELARRQGSPASQHGTAPGAAAAPETGGEATQAATSQQSK